MAKLLSATRLWLMSNSGQSCKGFFFFFNLFLIILKILLNDQVKQIDVAQM
jgi:hypothetical protein